MLQDLKREPKQVVVDLGYRGVDADNPGVQIIHRGKYKSLSAHEKRLLKRRQAIEPAIGHTKADHRMDRCWMKGALGDALHALCCAAGYNIRWLMRAIARGGLAAAFFVPRTLHGDHKKWLWAFLAAMQTSLAALLTTGPARRVDGGYLRLAGVP